MFLPYRDDNPHNITPVVNYTLIGLSVAVYVWQASLGARGEELALYAYGLIPGELFGQVVVSPQIGR